LRMRSEIERLRTPTEESLQFRVRLIGDDSVQADALADFILERCTDRRPFSRRPATPAEKDALEASVGTRHRIIWFEGPKRRSMARLMFDSSKIRLTIPEAYAVHREVIEWHARTSETKIPDQAVGLDPLGLVLMRWAMQSWLRTRILGSYFGGTLLPRLQLELMPGMRCAAHFLICAMAPANGVDDYLRAGAAVQRFWLTAERLGLRHQPEMTPLIFAGYAREGRRFTDVSSAVERAHWVARRLTVLAGREAAETAVWMGRIGVGSRPSARSLRRPLSDLLILPRAPLEIG